MKIFKSTILSGLIFISVISFGQNLSGIINVRNYGAIGDGKTDDTEAIQKAMNALPDKGGVIYFPPGQYLTASIKGRNYMTFKGDATFSWLSQSSGSPVISPVNDEMTCLFDLDGCVGITLSGLVLDGLEKGSKMNGVVSGHPMEEQQIPFDGTIRISKGEEQTIIIENCKITSFSGSGIHFSIGWVWAIRHSLIVNNGLDGLYMHGWDGYIIDSVFALNKRMGIYGNNLGASTITGSRVELNGEGGIFIKRGTGVQIANSFFCENRGPAIWIDGSSKAMIFTITGNLFRRNGKQRDNEPELNSNIYLTKVRGATVTGNSFYHVTHRWDDPKPYQWPRYSIVLDNLTDCVIANNAMFEGAWDQLIFDKGNHDNSVVKDNPGSLIDVTIKE